MKTITVKILLFAGLLLGLNGCYTIIWNPDTEFPTENSSTTIYYGDVYYGGYYYYYDYPWWLDIVPPVAGPVTRTRDNDIQDIRNTGGRGTPTRVPELQPPTRNKTTTTTGNIAHFLQRPGQQWIGQFIHRNYCKKLLIR